MFKVNYLRILQKLKKNNYQFSSNVLQQNIENFSKLDIRVGKIIECWKHPESETLYCEKIQIGQQEPILVVSGLQKFVSIENMSGLTIVLINLKPRKLAGIQSNGMLLCASDEQNNKVELLRPNDDSMVGERIFLDQYENLFSQELQPILNPKKKIFESVVEGMKTNENFEACFSGLLFKTKNGNIKSQTLKLCKIS